MEKEGEGMRFVGIDPSTKTGFVALDEHGTILKAKELTGVGDKDPKRMRTMIDEIMDHIRMDDVIVIEGFGYASQQAVQNGGIGWGIRMALDARKINYYEVAPNAVKKFVNVSGWTGEKGNKQRLTGPQKKKAIMKAVEEHFGFKHKSDNVVDAYIMAKIAEMLWTVNSGIECSINEGYLPIYQAEVIQQILNPAPKEKKKAK
jgi:crossover junction endodeoxyribonuclease RuvC